MLSQPIPHQNPAPTLGLKHKIRDCLTGYGFQEIITYSLTSLETLAKLMPKTGHSKFSPIRLTNPMTAEQEKLFGIEKLKLKRSELPAITHVDYSARIQTVHPETNPRYHALLTAFREKTGCGVLVNTSFNVRGEPIVCTPEDAYRCFMRTEMDYLVIEDFLLAKSDQPEVEADESWKDEFELD